MSYVIVLLIVAVVAAAFVWGDRNLGGNERASLASYLRDDPDAARATQTLPTTFLAWFDGLLGVRRRRILGVEIHLPSFGRSVILSTVALFFAAALWAAKKGFLDPENASQGLFNAKVGLPLITMYALGAIVSNLVPDYLSCVQSRFVLERMRKSSSLLAQFGWLLVDLVATAATVFVVLWVTARTFMPLVPPHLEHFVGCLRAEDLGFLEFGKIFFGGLTFSSPVGTQNYDAAGIYIFSSFLTSFWVWLFMASSLLSRAIMSVPALRRVLVDRLRITEVPLRALSLSAALLAALAFALPSLVGPLLPDDPGSVDGAESWHQPIELCQRRWMERHGWP